MSRTKFVLAVLAMFSVSLAGVLHADFRASDPGVRGGAPGAGDPFTTLSSTQLQFFQDAKATFQEVDTLAAGLGPRFNLDSCAGCHAQPATGGSSPALNPQVAVATAFGANNIVPFFVRPDGPVREARFKFNPDGTTDGGVHDLFVISGRNDTTADASGCHITQPDFLTAARNNNLIFRIPTPTFGAGLVEMIPDSVIIANQAAEGSRKSALGIHGRPHRFRISGTTNNNGNDGTISRFGWKAQNKSVLLFAGEAYNVEQGITNEIFQTERDETPSCQFATVPNDTTKTDVFPGTGVDTLNDLDKFALFMRFLAPPTPSPTTPGGAASIANGRALFGYIGCGLCHTPKLTTGNATVAALRNQDVNLFSDILLHNMGPGLADDIPQGQAAGDEFRTAPLWGLGQRIFFLHDGRTNDLIQAIEAHKSPASTKYQASEANAVVDNFKNLREGQKQDLLNFLRSL